MLSDAWVDAAITQVEVGCPFQAALNSDLEASKAFNIGKLRWTRNVPAARVSSQGCSSAYMFVFQMDNISRVVQACAGINDSW